MPELCGVMTDAGQEGLVPQHLLQGAYPCICLVQPWALSPSGIQMSSDDMLAFDSSEERYCTARLCSRLLRALPVLLQRLII